MLADDDVSDVDTKLLPWKLADEKGRESFSENRSSRI